MWQTKYFKTRDEMTAWLDQHDGQIQFDEIFIENGYGVEWRKLVEILKEDES